MLTLEEQIERVAEAAVEQSASTSHADVRTVRTFPSELPRRWLGVAAAVMLLALVGALVAVDFGRTDSQDDTAGPGLFAQPSATLPMNVPTVEYDSSETWLLPTWLPDGAEFDVAISFPGVGRRVRYRSTEWSEPLWIWTDTLMFQELNEGEVIDVDGDRWLVRSDAQPDGNVLRQLTPLPDNATEPPRVGRILVGTLDTETLVRIANGLVRRPATELERPALPEELGPNDGIVVARGADNIVREQLRVDTDGVYFSMAVDGDGGLPVRLDPDEFITVSATSAPADSQDASDNPTSILFGQAHPDVATVTLELNDGTTITTPVQDEHGFAQNFYIASFPADTEGDMHNLHAIVASDATGKLLQRIPNPFT